jgi:hypothetical protein
MQSPSTVAGAGVGGRAALPKQIAREGVWGEGLPCPPDKTNTSSPSVPFRPFQCQTLPCIKGIQPAEHCAGHVAQA